MKPFFTLISILFCINVQAQWTRDYYITFDSVPMQQFVYSVDTDTTMPIGKWQVGTPHKTVFTTGYGDTIALVTDTLQPCTDHDTMSCILSFAGSLQIADTLFYLANIGYWQSFDLAPGDTAYSEMHTSNQWNRYRKDSASASSSGWHYVSQYVPWYLGPNNFALRFTLITGDSTWARDGWMLDSFTAHYIRFTDIQEVQPGNGLTIYPNPASEQVRVVCSQETTVSLTDITGRRIAADMRRTGNKEWDIDVSKLPAGSYYCIMRQDGGLYKKKIVVVH